MDGNELTELVKRKLNITWSDTDTDARIVQIIEDGKSEIIDKVGIADPEFDFSKPRQERKLLLAYCFYEWNHALDEFQVNYAEDILQARERWEVVSHAKEQTDNI